MAETWYFNTVAGAACGDGDRESLKQPIGISATSKTLTNVDNGDTWNRIESPARTIQAGDWVFDAHISVDSGGGPGNQVTCLIRRMNSSCVEQEIIMDQTSGTLTKGATTNVVLTQVGVGQIAFDDGDRLIVELKHSAGSRVVNVLYNDVDPDDAFISHPDQTIAGGRRYFVIS
jgi:hypothetical protein